MSAVGIGFGLRNLAAASAPAASGAASGAASLAGPLGIGFAVLGAVLGGIAQRSKNKALARAARAAQLQLNEQITQARIQFADEVRRRSGIGQMMIAEARNRFGIQTGLSISERLAAMAADMTLDTEALKAARNARVSAIAFEKSRVVASAQSRVGSVGIAAVQGAIQGFTSGLNLSTSMKQLAALDRATATIDEQTAIFGELDGSRRATAFLENDVLRLRLSEELRATRQIVEEGKGIEGGLGGIQ